MSIWFHFKSSQVINLLNARTYYLETKTLTCPPYFSVEENNMDLDHQALMEKIFRIIASDNNMEYSDLVKELFLSFKSIPNKLEHIQHWRIYFGVK